MSCTVYLYHNTDTHILGKREDGVIVTCSCFCKFPATAKDGDAVQLSELYGSKSAADSTPTPNPPHSATAPVPVVKRGRTRPRRRNRRRH